MKESPPSEHHSELLLYSFDYLLYSSGIAYKRGGQIQIFRRDVAYSSLHIIWDPFDKMAAVYVY